MSTARHVLPLRNVTELMAAIGRALDRPAGVEGMVVLSGAPGLGKTWAATRVANEFDAILVELPSCVTRAGFCRLVSAEIGVTARPATIENLVREIGVWLADNPRRPLIVDEADHLAKGRGMGLEIIRDIYRLCSPAGAAIVLIGERTFKQTLERPDWERVASRVVEWAEALPVDAGDVQMLAEQLYPAMPLDDELVGAVLAEARGSVRRAINALHARHSAAAVSGGLRVVSGGEVRP